MTPPPASVGIHTFPNKKPKLDGAGEDSIGIINTVAVAGLGGSLSLSDGDTDVNGRGGSGSASAGQSPSASAGDVSVTVNVVKPNSIVVFAITGSTSGSGSNSPMTFNVEESAVLIASTGSVNPFIAINLYGYSSMIILFNVGAGSHTYDISKTGGIALGILAVTVEVIEVNDTHVGNISTPATATKQINAVDSHGTKNTHLING